MTIEPSLRNNQLGEHSDTSFQRISVPKLKWFFEEKAGEQTSYSSEKLENSDVCVGPRKNSKCSEIVNKNLLHKTSPSTEGSPIKVRFGEEECPSEEDVVKSPIQKAIEKAPTCSELHASLTPDKKNSNRPSPPPIRRGRSVKEQMRTSSSPSRFTSPSNLSSSSDSSTLPSALEQPKKRMKIRPVSLMVNSTPSSSLSISGFSPRYRASKLEPKTSPTLNTNIDSPVLDKLTNDKWIEGMSTSEKKSIDRSLIDSIKERLRKCHLLKSDLKVIQQVLDDFVKTEFDSLLDSHTQPFSDHSPSREVPESSAIYTQTILDKIQTSGVLTKNILSSMVEMKKELIDYVMKHKVKTKWIMEFANTLSYLIHFEKDLKEFINHLNKVSDKQILNLFHIYTENDVFEFLKQYVQSDSHDILRGRYSEIYVNYVDLSKIYSRNHFLKEPQDSILKFTDVSTKRITQSFTSHSGLRLESLTINQQKIDTSCLIGSCKEESKRFFTDFLKCFYFESNRHITPKELDLEVNQLINNKNVPSKGLLSLCTIPWNYFHEYINLRFPKLQRGIVTLPQEDSGSLHIDVGSDGNYRIIRVIEYNTYRWKRLSKGSSYGKPIGTIRFVWTITPVLSGKTWSGCIQVSQPIKLEKNVSYEMKWKILRGIIDCVDIKDQIPVNQLSMITDKEIALPFDQELIDKFDCPEPFANAVKPSSFMLEFLIKNYCREYVSDYWDSYQEGELEQMDVRDITESISEELKINGNVLEPLLHRLTILNEELQRFLIIKQKRTPFTDQLFTHIRDLIQSTKYAEYGVFINKDIHTFLKILDKDIKDEKIKRLILNVMCGRWENLNGRKDLSFQQRHTHSIIGILKCIRDSSVDLQPVISNMIDDLKTISREKILKEQHEWIEPQNKRSPISNIDVEQIVRCFMKDKHPIFEKVVINGIEIDKEGLLGNVEEMKKEYFERLLTTIYSHYDPKITKEIIEEQVNYIVSYKASEENKQIAQDKIPCLDLLKLCANSSWMVADIFIRNLYDINDSPIKSNVLENISVYIEIPKEGKYSVEHKRSYGIFPRETPDDISSYRVIKDHCLVEISFSWTLFPYTDGKRRTTKGVLTITDIDLTPDIPKEYEFIVLNALQNYNHEFRNTPNWEDLTKEPKLHMPLSLPIAKPQRVSTPRYSGRINPKP